MENYTLHEKLSMIQKEFKANKSKFNSFGKYNFRSAEDILEALKPFNEKYRVSFVIYEEMVLGLDNIQIPMLRSTAIIYDNNGINEISATAVVGVDLNQKGMSTSQQFGSASSYAKKYALGNLLLIDDTQDSDASNKHGKEEVKDEKKYLNKNTPEYNKAIEYIKGGGGILNIESKYILTKAVKDELLKIK